MSVRLISLTIPIVNDFYDDESINTIANSSENLISYCARVSNPENQTNFKTSPKLLKYCIENKHWSIFEQIDCSFEITTTRDIGRQILRHRSFSFQEFSQRYKEADTSSFVIREARLQDNKNRQNSIESDDKELQEEWEIWQNKVAQVTTNAYKWAIEKGIAKECARVVLAEGMTPTVMYMKGSLRSWIHWVELREKNGTQKEHSMIVKEVKDILINEFKFLKEYWKENINETALE